MFDRQKLGKVIKSWMISVRTFKWLSGEAFFHVHRASKSWLKAHNIRWVVNY